MTYPDKRRKLLSLFDGQNWVRQTGILVNSTLSYDRAKQMIDRLCSEGVVDRKKEKVSTSKRHVTFVRIPFRRKDHFHPMKEKGWVYFVRGESGMAIKIGFSVNPSRRVKTMQGGSPERLSIIGVVEGGREMEQQLHEQFQENRLWGEWFYPSPELIQFLGNIQGRRDDK